MCHRGGVLGCSGWGVQAAGSSESRRVKSHRTSLDSLGFGTSFAYSGCFQSSLHRFSLRWQV